MAKSNIRIKKICEWCGQEFVAQKVTTKYCSHRCANLAYKQAIRAKRIQHEEQRIQIVKSEKPLMDIKDKESQIRKEVKRLMHENANLQKELFELKGLEPQ